MCCTGALQRSLPSSKLLTPYPESKSESLRLDLAAWPLLPEMSLRVPLSFLLTRHGPFPVRGLHGVLLLCEGCSEVRGQDSANLEKSLMPFTAAAISDETAQVRTDCYVGVSHGIPPQGMDHQNGMLSIQAVQLSPRLVGDAVQNPLDLAEPTKPSPPPRTG